MTFISIALLSYFLGAVTVIMDKFLLGSKRISTAPVYSFYIALFGLFALFFIPFFDFYIPGGYQLFLSILSGIIFSFGILCLYFAIQKGEASRVTPVVGAVIPMITFFASFLFSSEKFFSVQLGGIALLIFGGLLISFDLPLKINKNKFFSGFYFSLLAGFLLAVSYLLFKLVYNEQPFLNGFVWTRIGSFCAIPLMLLIPRWKNDIFRSVKGFGRLRKREYQTGAIFVFNKIAGGISSIFINFSISLGSVTVVNSMVSSQYVFVLALAYFSHSRYPFVFEEKLKFWDWMQKIAAIILIGMGIVMIYPHTKMLGV